MSKVKLETNAGLTVNLADVKCFRIPIKEGSQSKMIVEFKTRYDYIINPETGEYEKQEYHEYTEVEFDSYDHAIACRDEWIAAWKHYLLNADNY